jgi:hypothetical protein
MQAELTAEEAKLILRGTDAELARYILRRVLRPAPHLEPYIMECPRASYEYARWVIRGRWGPGEPAILKSANMYIIGSYVRYVVRERWPEAEPILATDPWEAYQYAEGIIRGRWPEGERAIIQDPEWACCYAKHVLKGRWPEAEPTIQLHALWWERYQEEVLLCKKARESVGQKYTFIDSLKAREWAKGGEK